MAERYHPDIKVEIDWEGDGKYSHEYSDVTRFLKPSRVNYGTGLLPYTSGILFKPASGELYLDNREHEFDFIGGKIEAKNLVKPRLFRISLGTALGQGLTGRFSTTEVWFEGRVIMNLEATAEDYTVAQFSIVSKGYIYFGQPIRQVNNDEDGLLRDKIQQFALATHLDDGRETEQLFLFLNAPEVEAGLMYFDGYWPELLDYAGNMWGGWVYEGHTGILAVANLDEAVRADPDETLGLDRFEEIRATKGGALPGTLFNTARYIGQVLRAPEDDDSPDGIPVSVVATQTYQVTRGERIQIWYEIEPTEERRLIQWDRQPVETLNDPAPIFGESIVTETGIRADITPSITGILTVRFWGAIYRAQNAYSVDDYVPADPAFANSVRENGLQRLPLPPWQTSTNPETTGFPVNVSIAVQRRHLRYLYEPLLVAFHRYSMNQQTETLSNLLRDFGKPGRILEIAGRKELILNAGLFFSLNTQEIELRGIDLGSAAELPDTLPEFRRPGTPTVPLAVCQISVQEIDQVLCEPYDSCSIRSGGAVGLQWSRRVSRIRPGSGQLITFLALPNTRPQNPFPSRPGITSRNPVHFIWRYSSEALGRFNIWYVEIRASLANDGTGFLANFIYATFVGFSSGSEPRFADSVQITIDNTIYALGVDRSFRSSSRNRRFFVNTRTNLTTTARSILNSISGGVTRFETENAEFFETLRTSLFIAPGDASLNIPGAPSNARIMIQSREAGWQNLYRQLEGRQIIRGQTINFGTYIRGTGPDGNGTTAAFFTGDMLPARLACSNFDRLSRPLPPTTTTVSGFRIFGFVGVATAGVVTLVWDAANYDATKHDFILQRKVSTAPDSTYVTLRTTTTNGRVSITDNPGGLQTYRYRLGFRDKGNEYSYLHVSVSTAETTAAPRIIGLRVNTIRSGDPTATIEWTINPVGADLTALTYSVTSGSSIVVSNRDITIRTANIVTNYEVTIPISAVTGYKVTVKATNSVGTTERSIDFVTPIRPVQPPPAPDPQPPPYVPPPGPRPAPRPSTPSLTVGTTHNSVIVNYTEEAGFIYEVSWWTAASGWSSWTLVEENPWVQDGLESLIVVRVRFRSQRVSDNAYSPYSETTVLTDRPPTTYTISNFAAEAVERIITLTWNANNYLSDRHEFILQRKAEGAADNTYTILSRAVVAGRNSYEDTPSPAGSYTYRVGWRNRGDRSYNYLVLTIASFPPRMARPPGIVDLTTDPLSPGDNRVNYKWTIVPNDAPLTGLYVNHTNTSTDVTTRSDIAVETPNSTTNYSIELPVEPGVTFETEVVATNREGTTKKSITVTVQRPSPIVPTVDLKIWTQETGGNDITNGVHGVETQFARVWLRSVNLNRYTVRRNNRVLFSNLPFDSDGTTSISLKVPGDYTILGQSTSTGQEHLVRLTLVVLDTVAPQIFWTTDSAGLMPYRTLRRVDSFPTTLYIVTAGLSRYRVRTPSNNNPPWLRITSRVIEYSLTAAGTYVAEGRLAENMGNTPDASANATVALKRDTRRASVVLTDNSQGTSEAPTAIKIPRNQLSSFQLWARTVAADQYRWRTPDARKTDFAPLTGSVTKMPAITAFGTHRVEVYKSGNTSERSIPDAIDTIYIDPQVRTSNRLDPQWQIEMRFYNRQGGNTRSDTTWGYSFIIRTRNVDQVSLKITAVNENNNYEFGPASPRNDITTVSQSGIVLPRDSRDLTDLLRFVTLRFIGPNTARTGNLVAYRPDTIIAADIDDRPNDIRSVFESREWE